MNCLELLTRLARRSRFDRGRRSPDRVWILLLVAALASPAPALAQRLRDNFAARELLTDVHGSIDANNTSATIEPGEPLHGGKRGGHSLWISWIAPTNGVLKIETSGSAFDTLLSAYSFASPTNTGFGNLIERARADDSEGFEFESEVRFGVLAGQRYEIAVDGYFGAAGYLEFSWDFETNAVAPPIILSQPADQVVGLGDPVVLAVAFTNQANGTYRWYRNDVELDAFSPTLTIPSMQPGHVGRYKLRVLIDGASFYSVAMEVQINSEGPTDTFARDKLPDAPGAPLPLLFAAGAGVTRGYNGSQIFNTTYAVPDPNEPRHCDLTGGASYWYAYTPPADGTLVLDTIGSSFDTFIAVYAYEPPLTGYGDLVAIACDNDSAGTNGAARLEFAAPRNRSFVVVIDGLNGARGTARLNYRLDTNLPPVLPTLVAPQAQLAAAVGSSITLEPTVTGSAPLRFQWQRGNAAIVGATNHHLVLNSLTTSHTGEYSVSVSNHVGGPLLVPFTLRVLLSPVMQLQATAGGGFLGTFVTTPGQTYLLEEAETPAGPWLSTTNIFPGTGASITITNLADGVPRFFRLRVQ